MTNVQTNLKNPICLLPKSLQIGLDDQVVINGQCGWVDFIGVDTIALITSQNELMCVKLVEINDAEVIGRFEANQLCRVNLVIDKNHTRYE